MKAVETRIDSRRRYGNVTYTWVSALINGRWTSLGDPWPCVTPAKKEVLAAISALKDSHETT